MAGYPKLWTTILHEPWFKRLGAVQRAIWLQLILIAKEQTDDGNVTFTSISNMASELACDRRSIYRWMERECDNWCAHAVEKSQADAQPAHGKVPQGVRRVCAGRAHLVEKSQRLAHLYLVHYNDSQELRRYAPKQKSVGTRAINQNKPSKNFPKENSNKGDKPGYTKKVVKAPGTDKYVEVWVPNNELTAREGKEE